MKVNATSFGSKSGDVWVPYSYLYTLLYPRGGPRTHAPMLMSHGQYALRLYALVIFYETSSKYVHIEKVKAASSRSKFRMYIEVNVVCFLFAIVHLILEMAMRVCG